MNFQLTALFFPGLWKVVFQGSSHAVLSGMRITLSPLQLMMSYCHWTSGSSHCCCLHPLFSIPQTNRTTFSHSSLVCPPGSVIPCLSAITKGRRCPSTFSDHLTAHNAHLLQWVCMMCRQQTARTVHAATVEHMGLLSYLALQKQSSNGKLQVLLCGSCSNLVICWHSYPGHIHPSALLPAVGLRLLVLLPFSHPQRYLNARLPWPIWSYETIIPVVFGAKRREEERQADQYPDISFLFNCI